MLRDNLANTLRIPRPLAARIERWLKRLHERDCVHGECGAVSVRGGQEGITLAVGTIDYERQEVGCAWCGEFKGEHGKAMEGDSVLVTISYDEMPHELRGLFQAGVLYCGDCWRANRDAFVSRYKL